MDYPRSPHEALKYISYTKPGGYAAPQYRRWMTSAKQFNEAMGRIFSRHAAFNEAIADQVFHLDRESEENDMDVDKNDSREIDAARKLYSAAKAVAQIMTTSACHGTHSVYINLSGFEEAEIFTLMNQCNSRDKWRAVKWTSSNRHDAGAATKQPPGTPICKEIKKTHRPKRILHMGVCSDGSWHTHNKTSTTRHAKPPETTLDKLIISGDAQEHIPLKKSERLSLATRLARSLLCLMGSPFLREPWSAETMLCSESDIFTHGDFSQALSNETAATQSKSFILSLGALLWELFFLQKVSIIETDHEGTLFNALNREEAAWRERCVDVACLDTISHCLDAYCEDQSDEEELRAAVYGMVFRPLREYWASYSCPASNDAAKVTHPEMVYRPSLISTEIPVPISRKSLGNGAGNGIARSSMLQVQETVQLTVIPELNEPCRASLLDATPGPTTNSWSWIKKFHYANQHLASLDEDTGSKAAKIAILDTGCDKASTYFTGAGVDRVEDWRGLWYDCLGDSSEPVDEDAGHHGTALTSLLLQLAPRATVYAMRVARNSSGLAGAQNAIADAILYAAASWGVDIISMSFGFSDDVKPIQDAIKEAEKLKDRKIFFFAAANNDGLNEPEMFPAFSESVISARGTNHDGSFIQQYNPSPWSHKAGFQYGTLARDVPYGWPAKHATKSGSSVATPILAAIAAVVIAFVDG